MPEENKVSVGGQALMEGVMMNGPKGVAMALRLPDGKRAGSSPEELISGYISGFDKALKSFFAHLDNPDAAAAVEQIYRDCILGRGITV